MDAIQPPRFKGLKSVDMAKQTMKTFFMVMLDLNVYKKELENQCIQQDEEMLLMKNQIAVLKENSTLSGPQQKAAMKKQIEMRSLVNRMGSTTDFVDNRDIADNM